ncbi:MAG: PAS domain S-box protein [Nitrospiraceae bacterium]|nr:MAG: PAS domain S-box protein [Nitrospiraceae bacterium]
MAKKKTYQGDADDLRRSADEKVRGKYAGTPEDLEASPGVKRLIHELRVYQVELEMQNEELRNAQLALEETNEKYISLYDFAPVGYITITHEALIKEVNLTGAALLGIERQKLINARFRQFVAPEDLDKWDSFFVNVFSQVGDKRCDIQLIRKDKALFYARFDSIWITENDGIPVVRAAMSDITETRKAEEALKRSFDEIERKNKELQDALANVKTLSSLLPICSYCKKIRDDKGYWNQLESYITKHTDALFSHGMCPACEGKAYKELEKWKKDMGK